MRSVRRRGQAPQPVSAALRNVTENCLDKDPSQPDVKTCFDAGYAQGAKAFGPHTYSRFVDAVNPARNAAETAEEWALVAREVAAERQDLFSLLLPDDHPWVRMDCALGKGPEIVTDAKEENANSWRQDLGGIDAVDLCVTALTRAVQGHAEAGIYADLVAKQRGYDGLDSKRITAPERSEISKTAGHLAHDIATAVSKHQSVVAIGSGAHGSMKITPSIAFDAGFVLNRVSRDFLDSQTLPKMGPEVIRVTALKCLNRRFNPAPALPNCLVAGYALGTKAIAEAPSGSPKSLSPQEVLLLEMSLITAKMQVEIQDPD